jgi:hypothetical protein
MEATTKVCRECLRALPLESFYPKHGRCRACYCQWQTEYNRRYMADPVNRAKQNARSRVAGKVRRGTMAKAASCTRCGAMGPLDGHHPDHLNQPLLVEWLCEKCHGKCHTNNPHGCRGKPRKQAS